MEPPSSSHGQIRVAHVTLGLDVGGLEKLLVEFARQANRERFELRFVSLTSRGTLAEEIEACGWPVTALEAPAGFRPRITVTLARLLRRWQIDLVHTHDEKPLVYAGPAARLAGVRRVVHTRHGQRPQLTRRQRFLVRIASRLTDHFVCVSQDIARHTVEQGVAGHLVRTIWNGIDTERFAYVGARADGPIVCVARLSPEKGVVDLVHATALAIHECPSLRVEIAGDGPCLAQLKNLTEELGISGHVRFLGQVRDVPALLAQASLFVLPSLSEGVSLTLLEAMARGLPVVATRVGGNCEVVVHGETGLLVPAKDPGALAVEMLQLRSDPQRADAMGRAGRRRMEHLFDVRSMVAAYQSLYLGHELGGTSVSLPATHGLESRQRLQCTLSS
ncbi:MAG TPA: glycosyltransferase [Gemmataceae bacterium]|nr:glycosyltransferase [Gemmataceae bacterium]